MQEYSHGCIKCGEVYKDTDVDAYYCLKCLIVVKEIGRTIDKKLGQNVSRQTKSDLQIFDEQGVTLTAPNGRKLTLMRTKL